MSQPDRDRLIHDWNTLGAATPPASGRVLQFDDETLRDGLQSPSVVSPPVADKLRILHAMDRLGIHTADIGLPGAGPKAREDVERLAREIADNRLRIAANCAARTVEADIRPIAEASQKAGIPIEACLFIGSSPIRQYAEDWTIERMLEHTESAIRFAVGQGLPVMYVTEDTTRAHPDDLRRLYGAAVRCGAKRVCLCDTVGHATPEGTRNLVRWMGAYLKEIGAAGVGIDWHGHNDRGLSVPNALAAIEAGADRIHGTALGIGERVGNCPMDILLVNLKLLGLISQDLRGLSAYCGAVSEACRVPIPANYPVVGPDAFETATGVHAAAVIKAFRKGDTWLADRVYSGVPAGDFGLEQRIRVGPMSGRSNVIHWLERHGFDPSEEKVERVFAAAKRSDRLLTDDELRGLLGASPPPGA
ncbi:MAG: 2-isopropylmalate synthase [Planctomycetes bacterium]|nr:2-isopropylmalate synthase [Planctomycetota bacterium]